MNDYTAISAISQSLLDVLKAGINQKTGVSLWLYRIARNPDLLNAPPRRISPTQMSQRDCAL